MIIRSVQGLGNLNDFYRKSEVEFLGKEINYRFMTPQQLNATIAQSIALYNKLYPPKQMTGFDKFMRKAIPVIAIAGLAVVSGGAILAAYGVEMGTAIGAVTGAGSAGAASSTIASIQTGATYISTAGALYGKVTGDTPDDLMKVAELVKSESALDAMELVAREEMIKKGINMQAGDKASQAALRERLKKEQQVLSEKMMIAADKKAQSLGQQTPQKKKPTSTELAMLATPFILYFLG